MSCFSYTSCASGYLQYYDNKRLVLSCLVTQTLYFSQFFSTFLCRFTQNLCANVLNFEYQHLFIACKN